MSVLQVVLCWVVCALALAWLTCRGVGQQDVEPKEVTK